MTDQESFDSPPVDSFDPDDPSLFVERPKWPKIVGALSIVFGSIAVFCGAFSFIGPTLNAPPASDLAGAPVPPYAVLSVPQIISGVIGELINLLLIVAGVMCVTYRRPARPLHLVYAVLSLVSIGIAVWASIDQQNAMARWLADYPDNTVAQNYQKAMQIMGPFILVFGIVMLLIALVWPTFCLIWFGLKKTKREDMTAEPPRDTLAA